MGRQDEGLGYAVRQRKLVVHILLGSRKKSADFGMGDESMTFEELCVWGRAGRPKTCVFQQSK